MNQLTPRLAIFTAGVFLLLILTGCGIPSYPYLYPPEALGGGRVGFTHDEDNDPTVFVGYEIFYRFYSTDPGSIGATSLAEQDMRSFFSSSFQISSIVYEDSSSAYNKGFRRAYIEKNGDTPPQLPVEAADISSSFDIQLVDNDSEAEIQFTYDSTEFTLLRSVLDTDNNHKSFLPVPITNNEVYDFVNGEDDIVEGGVDSDNIFVAFFAVPYGIDPETLATLYANGNYEGMEYIGYFDLS